MFKILIIDDDVNQYEEIRSKLLQFSDDFPKDKKDKVIKDFLKIKHFERPTEAENFIATVNPDNKPDIVICDMNFQGFNNENDNGRERGLEIVAKVRQKWASIPIVVITFYGTDPIINKVAELLPQRHYPGGIYAVPKEKVIDRYWTNKFCGLLRDIVSDEQESIKKELGKEKKDKIKFFLKGGNEKLAFNITLKNRKWNFEQYLLGWLVFQNAEENYKYDINNIDLTIFLNTIVDNNTAEINREIINLLRNYENKLSKKPESPEDHETWQSEIRECVERDVRSFFQYDWNRLFKDGFKDKDGNRDDTVFYTIGNVLNLRNLNSFDIENRATQSILINWLKARLFIISLYHIIKNQNVFLTTKLNYPNYNERNIIAFIIIVGLQKNLAYYDEHFNQKNGDRRAVLIRQYFYNLRFTGSIGRNIIDYNSFLEEEKQWVELYNQNWQKLLE